MIRPGADEAARLLSQGFRVPVVAELRADLETPTSAYWKLAHNADRSFLLESVTGGEALARYSFLGVNPRTEARSLAEVRTALGAAEYARFEGMPRFTGGAVGILAYDLVREFERLPVDTVDDLGVRDVHMLVCDTVVAFDHAKNRMLIISHASPDGPSFADACSELERVKTILAGPMPPMPASPTKTPIFAANMSRDAYEAAVGRIIEYIRAGDGIQMVMSQRFSAPVASHPMNLYRALRYVNPSPYMYLLRLGDCDVVGASPEVLVTVEGNTARVRPIAGTRARGETNEQDGELEAELLADEKERAEHIMLVDLGRNDIGRIAKAGSVKVNELMAVERYSHVMHIVSDVTGEVQDGLDSFDVLRACFPAGTVSGAPKVRAMEIIEELEPTRRGLYAGAVGYIGFDGDMDMAIAIRTILLKDGKAHVQAGAGIVFDSIPEKEWEECRNKAAAVIRAIEMAESGEL